MKILPRAMHLLIAAMGINMRTTLWAMLIGPILPSRHAEGTSCRAQGLTDPVSSTTPYIGPYSRLYDHAHGIWDFDREYHRAHPGGGGCNYEDMPPMFGWLVRTLSN